MPGIAHNVVNNALSYGLDTLEWTKKKDGTLLKWAVEKVERPAKYTLETRLCQTALKVGDSCLTLADNTIESALNTSTYKSCEALVKSTSNKLRPVCANTTSCVTTPIGKVYVGTLAIANRQVDYFLPGDNGANGGSLTIVSLVKKVSRRTGRRVYVAKEWTVSKVSCVANGVVYTVKQAHPVNVKNNVLSLCQFALIRADQLVDRYLPDPEDHSPKPTGPITLTTKVVRRSVKRTVIIIRAAAMAVRNSPATFKAAARSAVGAARAAPARARAAARAVVTYDYRGAAASRALATVSLADRALQRFRLTAALRDFVAARFGLLARLLVQARASASSPARSPVAAIAAPPQTPSPPPPPPVEAPAAPAAEHAASSPAPAPAAPAAAAPATPPSEDTAAAPASGRPKAGRQGKGKSGGEA
jgi:hypothetical protein